MKRVLSIILLSLVFNISFAGSNKFFGVNNNSNIQKEKQENKQKSNQQNNYDTGEKELLINRSSSSLEEESYSSDEEQDCLEKDGSSDSEGDVFWSCEEYGSNDYDSEDSDSEDFEIYDNSLSDKEKILNQMRINAQYVTKEFRKEFKKFHEQLIAENPSDNPKYKRKGFYSTELKPVTREKVKNILSNIPEDIQILINNIKNPLKDKDARPTKLLLVGPAGTGKTLLSKAMALKTKRRYYYIKTPYLLDSWKNCHQNILAEMKPLMDDKEPLIVIFDEIDQVTNQYKNNNSSDSGVPSAFWLMLDTCEQIAPHLFVIGTSNNDKLDFPDQVRSRFGLDIVTISLPNEHIRKSMILHCLDKTNHTLTDTYIDRLVERLKDRSCRDIENIMNKAKQRANDGKSKEITVQFEHIDLTINAFPKELSKDKRLARRLDVSEKKVRAAREDKHLLESEKTVVDFILRTKGMKQTEEHHKQNLMNSKRGLLYSYAQSLISTLQLYNSASRINRGKWFTRLKYVTDQLKTFFSTKNPDKKMRDINFAYEKSQENQNNNQNNNR